MAACHESEKKQQTSGIDFDEDFISNPTIARGFRVSENGDVKLIELFNPWDTTQPGKKIYLTPEENKGENFPDGDLIRVPVKSMVCMSATHLSYLQAIDEIDLVTGVSNADYFVSEEFKALINDGQVLEVGIGDRFKLEKLINLAPEIVLVSPQKGQIFQPLINAGLTVVPVAEYLETHPLGRAEWIKFIGLLTGKADVANYIFDSIANQYNSLKELTATISEKPTVLTGKQYGGFWNLSGGRSYEATFLLDAGADYIWSDDLSSGGIMLDFETVYEKGLKADFWRFLVYSQDDYSYEILLEEDTRYADFYAFKRKKIITCNTLKTPFFEKGFLEPQIILADYIHIFHPELLPGHQNVYYNIMK